MRWVSRCIMFAIHFLETNRAERKLGHRGKDREPLSKGRREEAVDLRRIGDKMRPIAPAEVGAARRPR